MVGFGPPSARRTRRRGVVVRSNAASSQPLLPPSSVLGLACPYDLPLGSLIFSAVNEAWVGSTDMRVDPGADTSAMVPEGLPSEPLSGNALGVFGYDGVSRSGAPNPTATLIALAAPGRNPTDVTIPTTGSEVSGGDDDAIVGGPSSGSTGGSSSAAETAASENGSGTEVASAGSSSGTAGSSTSASTAASGSSGGSSGSSGSSGGPAPASGSGSDGTSSVVYAAAGESSFGTTSSATSTGSAAAGSTGQVSGGSAAGAEVAAADEASAPGSHEEPASGNDGGHWWESGGDWFWGGYLNPANLPIVNDVFNSAISFGAMWQAAWDHSERNVERMNKLVAAGGADSFEHELSGKTEFGDNTPATPEITAGLQGMVKLATVEGGSPFVGPPGLCPSLNQVPVRGSAKVGRAASAAEKSAAVAPKSALEVVPEKYRGTVGRAFEGAPVAETLEEDLIVYRRSGGKSPETGSPWYASTPYQKPGNAQRPRPTRREYCGKLDCFQNP